MPGYHLRVSIPAAKADWHTSLLDCQVPQVEGLCLHFMTRSQTQHNAGKLWGPWDLVNGEESIISMATLNLGINSQFLPLLCGLYNQKLLKVTFNIALIFLSLSLIFFYLVMAD